MANALNRYRALEKRSDANQICQLSALGTLCRRMGEQLGGSDSQKDRSAERQIS
jgi:hypothetical protein